MKLKLWAAEELLKRYLSGKKLEISTELLIDCTAVIFSNKTVAYQKKAAKIILAYSLGRVEANNLIESNAVVVDRNDALVSRWRKKVLDRDGCCVRCGEEKNLHAHHISHWSDDPVNRINVDNGVTLCSECHSMEHPEISSLILSGVN